MKEPREKKLAKLLAVHGELRAFHEGRRAGFLRAAAESKAEAESLVARFDEAGSLGALFPELYHARIAGAFRREAEQAALAEAEAATLAGIALREKAIAEALAEEQRGRERWDAERTVLDWVETRLAGGRA